MTAGAEALHDLIWPRLLDAIATGKGHPLDPDLARGSFNYRAMVVAQNAIVDPIAANKKHLADFLLIQELYHGTHPGLAGVQCEQGTPLAHRAFVYGSVFGALSRLSDDRSLSRLIQKWIADEIGLLLPFRLPRRGRRPAEVWLPAPRVKGGPVVSGRDRGKTQEPHDAWGDMLLAVAFRDAAAIRSRSKRWWSDPLSTGVRLAEALPFQATGFDLLHADPPMPKLYLPIHQRQLPTGWEAWIEDTPEARAVMGRDGCHRVRVEDGKPSWWYDWEEPEGL